MAKTGPKVRTEVGETKAVPKASTVVPAGGSTEDLELRPNPKLSRPKLADVSSRYGAPMGRVGGAALQPEGLVTVVKVTLDSGGYDEGGAYWGLPNDLYMADDGGEYREFLRAKNRAEATKVIQGKFPQAEFSREPDYDAFLQGYLACAAWSGPEDESDSNLDFTKAAIKAADEQCRAFIDANWKDLCDLDESDSGHDFWLTRNGHGAGFWDRNEIPKAIRDRLTEASKKAGEVNVRVSRKKLNFE